MIHLRIFKVKTFWFSLLSALLLTLSFPRAEWSFLVWIGLIPLLLALDGKSAQSAFGIGYLTGLIFFAMTLYWFVHVTFVGAIFLVLYFALYFAVFGLGYSLSTKIHTIFKLFFIPSLWVSLEYIRGHLLTGFGWASLGHSQYKNLVLIQIADMTGVFGISFLIVMVNVFLKECLSLKNYKAVAKSRKDFLIALVIVSTFMGLSLGYGIYRLRPMSVLSKVKIAIVQANTQQEFKWQEDAWPDIMKTYMNLTREVAKEKPDLIIWPESSFPGYVWEKPEEFKQLKNFVDEMKIPLLMGLVTVDDEAFYNSAILISKEGKIIEQYNKLHLVPFGEYIPFRKLLPFISAIVPIGDFTAGKEYTLFPVFDMRKDAAKLNKNFSVLICFEDTVPELSRTFTRHGANMLVNITNDAWFQDTRAPYLHWQAAIFRSVENRRTLVRAANTGVSGFVNSHGKILNYIQGPNKKATYISGFTVCEVDLNEQQTFYTRYGDIFTYLCFGVILLGVILRVKMNRPSWR